MAQVRYMKHTAVVKAYSHAAKIDLNEKCKRPFRISILMPKGSEKKNENPPTR